MEKIKLGFYPYTYVRSVVMRSLLYKKADYDKILKMSVDEIIKYLEEGSYKNQINEYAANYSGPLLAEISLNKNKEQEFIKLRKISEPNLRLLIDAYLRRIDVENIKTVLRTVYSGLEDTKELLNFGGTLSKEFYEELLKLNVEDIIKRLGSTEFKYILPSLEEYKNKGILTDVENALDKGYYNSLFNFSKRIPGAGLLFREFIQNEIARKNILTLLKLRTEGVSKDDIKKYLIMPDKWMHNSLFLSLFNKDSVEDILSELANTEYGSKELIEEYKKSGSLILIESMLVHSLLEKTRLFSHQNPLSVSVILGFMFSKELEVKNLKTIIKSKELELGNEFIEAQIVV